MCIVVGTITSENADMLEKLDIDKTAKAKIKQVVKNGKTVVVPEEDIYYYEWKGTGYIILDTETFAAAYMISGGICGGSTFSKLAFSIAGMVKGYSIDKKRSCIYNITVFGDALLGKYCVFFCINNLPMDK